MERTSERGPLLYCVYVSSGYDVGIPKVTGRMKYMVQLGSMIFMISLRLKRICHLADEAYSFELVKHEKLSSGSGIGKLHMNGDVLSAEDLALVDSCLVKDPEVPDCNWDALRDVFVEIVNLQPEAVANSSSGSDGTSVGTDIETHHPDKETDITLSEINDHDVVPTSEESETNDDSYSINKKMGIPISELFQGGIPISKLFEGVDTIGSFVGNPFQPSYKEEDRVSEAADLGLDLSSLAIEIEPLSENIFKVWDLRVPDEEDELITQLNNALAESSPGSVPSALDDSGTWKDMKDESLNNLIAGIADLSLDQSSS